MDNRELAQKLRDLRDFLIIAGYEESHAFRYTNIARFIEKMPEDVNVLKREFRLREIPGVGKLIQLYIKEILEDGVSSKQKEWESTAPITVLELVRIPGLGAGTARRLFLEHGIYDLRSLKLALETGTLEQIHGIGPKLIETIRGAVKDVPLPE
jgi:DNA polymerase (family 10)